MKEENRVFIELPEFSGRNVPIMELQSHWKGCTIYPY